MGFQVIGRVEVIEDGRAVVVGVEEEEWHYIE